MGFYIGNVYIENRIVCAPMAGITNYAYRRIAREFGCGLTYTEMISDKGLNYRNERTKAMTVIDDNEHPVSMQLFGSGVEDILKAAIYLDTETKCDIIDINMGCPVVKVAKKSEAGSALLKNPQLVYEIVKAVVENVKKPVTVKIRSGWDSESINAVAIARLIESAGASAIAIHARTRNQFYSGKADWTVIKAIKEAVSIPVIGNGDIYKPEDALRMIEETNCDAVMIGRGGIGNPWLFRDIRNKFTNSAEQTPPTHQEVYDAIVKHYKLLFQEKPDKRSHLEMKTLGAYYLKGLPENIIVKKRLFQSKDINEYFFILNNYFHILLKIPENNLYKAYSL